MEIYYRYTSGSENGYKKTIFTIADGRRAAEIRGAAFGVGPADDTAPKAIYSLRKECVGFANAALNALMLTVIRAIATVITAASTKIHQYIGVR